MTEELVKVRKRGVKKIRVLVPDEHTDSQGGPHRLAARMGDRCWKAAWKCTNSSPPCCTPRC